MKMLSLQTEISYAFQTIPPSNRMSRGYDNQRKNIRCEFCCVSDILRFLEANYLMDIWHVSKSLQRAVAIQGSRISKETQMVSTLFRHAQLFQQAARCHCRTRSNRKSSSLCVSRCQIEIHNLASVRLPGCSLSVLRQSASGPAAQRRGCCTLQHKWASARSIYHN